MQLSALKIHVYVSPVSQNKATKIKDSKKLETSKSIAGQNFEQTMIVYIFKREIEYSSYLLGISCQFLHIFKITTKQLSSSSYL